MYVVQWNDAFVKLVKKGRLEVPDVVACTTMAEVRRNVSEFGEKPKPSTHHCWMLTSKLNKSFHYLIFGHQEKHSWK